MDETIKLKSIFQRIKIKFIFRLVISQVDVYFNIKQQMTLKKCDPGYDTF